MKSGIANEKRLVRANLVIRENFSLLSGKILRTNKEGRKADFNDFIELLDTGFIEFVF